MAKKKTKTPEPLTRAQLLQLSKWGYTEGTKEEKKALAKFACKFLKAVSSLK